VTADGLLLELELSSEELSSEELSSDELSSELGSSDDVVVSSDEVVVSSDEVVVPPEPLGVDAVVCVPLDAELVVPIEPS
jgi:hypothetical protein